MALGDNTVTLSTGRVLKIDFYQITMREWRSLFNSETTLEQGDAIYAKLLGITVDELLDLPQLDYRYTLISIIDTAQKPLDNPNSPSASTSD